MALWREMIVATKSRSSPPLIKSNMAPILARLSASSAFFRPSVPSIRGARIEKTSMCWPGENFKEDEDGRERYWPSLHSAASWMDVFFCSSDTAAGSRLSRSRWKKGKSKGKGNYDGKLPSPMLLKSPHPKSSSSWRCSASPCLLSI